LHLEHAQILQRREGEVYVHYLNTDKRLDEWVSEGAVKPAEDASTSSSSHPTNGRKRKRDETRRLIASSSSPARYRSVDFALDDDDLAEIQAEVSMTEEDYDIQHHKQITAQRNFDKVNFGHWQMKTWYVAGDSLRVLTQKWQVLFTIPSDGIRDRRAYIATFNVQSGTAHPRRP
jgi:RNA binding activity-knot of a chromodomain